MANGPSIKYDTIQNEIYRIRGLLVSTPQDPTVDPEKVNTAIRNLDLAACVLECNQSLSPFDYNQKPWEHIPKMRVLLKKRKKEALKAKRAEAKKAKSSMKARNR